MTLFQIQLLTSFIVGGVSIAALSFIAERASAKTAGIIISFPTTIAIGFFFIGWATSPTAVVDAVAIIPAMEGVVALFTTAYLYLSKIRLRKGLSIVVSTVGSLAVWAGLAFPLAAYKFSHLGLSVLMYMILAGIAYYFITIKPHESAAPVSLKYSTSEKIYRALFAGTVTALAVYLSKTLGTVWGMIFSAFPAVYISTMTIIYKNHSKAMLFKVFKNSPLGTLVFVLYAIAAMYTFPALGLLGGTIVSYIISGIGMYWLMTSSLTNVE